MAKFTDDEAWQSFWTDRPRNAFLRYAHERFFICHDERGDFEKLYAELRAMIGAAKEISAR